MKYLFLIMLFLLASSACERDKVEPDGPFEVEYRVSSSSGAAVAYISYTNETGATTTLDEAPLPFSAKFKSSQRSGALSLLVIVPNQGGQQQLVTGAILVDGQPVETGTGTGPTPDVNLIHVLQ